MKKTPKTGYQSKKNPLMSPAGSAWIRCMRSSR